MKKRIIIHVDKYFTKKRVYALALAAVMANSMLGYGSGLVAHAADGECEHTYSELVEETAATCVANGTKAHYTCTVEGCNMNKRW